MKLLRDVPSCSEQQVLSNSAWNQTNKQKNSVKLTNRCLAAASTVEVTQVKHKENDGQTQNFEE